MLGSLYLFKKRNTKKNDEVKEERHNGAEDLASECKEIIKWSNWNGSNRTCILHNWWKVVENPSHIEKCHEELQEKTVIHFIVHKHKTEDSSMTKKGISISH